MIDKLPDSINNQLALDPQAGERLRVQANADPQRALKGVTREFEAMFMNMLLKSMREASPKDGLFDSEQSALYTSMLDEQFARSMSQRGLGLAETMFRQLSQSLSKESQPGAAAAQGNLQLMARTNQNVAQLAPAAASNASGQVLLNPFGVTPQPYSDSIAAPAGRASESVITAARASDAKPLRGTERARHFAQQLMPHAEAASRETGIPARFLIGHAALESGWGRFEPRGADGARSYNLFGIKAGKNWTGPVVEARTSEYVDGRRVVTVERFRAYESYADAFRDYSDFLRGNRRYANVLEHSQRPEEFARGLQKAGYATDPAYANKLVRILNGRLLRETATA